LSIPPPKKASILGGLSFKNVKHTIDRPCMWYAPPHNRTAWKLKPFNKWRANDYKKRRDDKDYAFFKETGLTERFMRDIRRKQFFAFFEGFFDVHNQDTLKMKVHNLNFTADEKQALLKQYFEKYFNERLDVSSSIEDQKVSLSTSLNTMLKSQETSSRAAKLDPAQVYLQATNNKAAFLGKSDGIVNAFNMKEGADLFKKVFNERRKAKMKAPKVLLQSQYVPDKIRCLEDLNNGVGARLSPRSIGLVNDSSLSHRLSAIP